MSFRPMFRAVTLALVLCSAVAASLAVNASAAPAKGDAAAGKTVYMTKCIACHKKDGTGGFKVSGLPTANWTLKKTWDATRTEAYIRDCITNGKIKDGMVAWGKTGQLKPAEIDNLVAFILTFKATAK